jgi:DNA-binding MarR family transcriptional regulator
MRQRLVHARLLTLLRLVRMSSAIAYRRELGLVELHRRVLALVGNYDGLTSVHLVALAGQEKAQISRAVKLLTEAGLVERASLRAKVMLTEAGAALYDRIITLALQRDAAITRGVSGHEMSRLADTTARLIDRAALLLADERRISDTAPPRAALPGDEASGFTDPPPLPELARRPDRQRILSRMAVPPLITLVSYLQRSAPIAYRRETNLSTFGWRILSQIGEHQPLTLARLIALTARDKSQIGRAVQRLEAAGLVQRQRDRREIILTTTAAGSATYLLMCEDALRRDNYLLADLTPADHDAFLETVATLTANAEALLAQERAGQA